MAFRVFDAEGGFYAGLSGINESINKLSGPEQTRGVNQIVNIKQCCKHIRLRLSAFVDQKMEFDVLQRIAFLFDVSNVYLQNKEKQTYRVDCKSKKSLQKILIYFDRYDLRSKKHIVYALWRKIAFLYLRPRPQSFFENLEKLQKQISRIQAQNRIFKENKTCLPK